MPSKEKKVKRVSRDYTLHIGLDKQWKHDLSTATQEQGGQNASDNMV